MKCATCFALTRMPTPNSSTPGLLLMMVRSRVPRLCSALMRFSGSPHRPKPPHITVAPLGINATASSALFNSLFMSVIILHQFRAPFRGRRENGFDGVAAPQIAAKLRQPLNEAVERVANRIRIRETDVAPHVSGTRRQSRRIDETAPGHAQPLTLRR